MPKLRRALATWLAAHVHCVHTNHLHLERLFDGVFDVEFVRVLIHDDLILVVLLRQRRALFGDADGLDDFVRRFHYLFTRAASFAKPAFVATILSKRNSS